MNNPPILADLVALDFGYLTGQDLINVAYGQQALILKAMAIGISPQTAVTTAYSLIKKQTLTKVDLVSEYLKRTTFRDPVWVWVTAIYALEILFTGASGLPDNLMQTFTNARDYVKAVMMGQMSEPNLKPSIDVVNSIGYIVKSNFGTLG